MEESSSFLIKTLIGSAFAIGGGLYLYFSLFKGDDNNQKIITDYIREYIKEIKERIEKDKNWKYNMEILCHLNYIIDEIVNNEIKVNHSHLLKERLNSFDDHDKYIQSLTNYKEQFKIIKKKVMEKVIKQDFDIDIDNISAIMNIKLKNTPQNKSFHKYIPYDSSEYEDIIKEKDNKELDDCFFFASVNQVNYDKLVESKINSFNELDTEELEDFTYKFKDDFMIRYGFDCKYLNEIMVKKEGDRAIQLNLLINRVIF